jgi:fatty acid desaturase
MRRKLRRWAVILLVGHALIVVGSAFAGWWFHQPRLWLIPVVTTFAPYYGGWLHFLCNSSQHVGLKDNVGDFRLCCRTIYLNPFFRFIYWHMNYHTEHHMYAAVPCYKLGRLHRLIKDQMPECPRGLYATWKHIGEILERQKSEPGYQFEAKLPERVDRAAVVNARSAQPSA